VLSDLPFSAKAKANLTCDFFLLWLSYLLLISLPLLVEFPEARYNYFKVFRFVTRHNRPVAPRLHYGISSYVEEVKVTKILALVVVGFLVCWVSTGITEAINTSYIIHRIKVPVFAKFLQTIFIYASSAINPLIYTLTNKRFRKEYVIFLSRVLEKCHQCSE